MPMTSSTFANDQGKQLADKLVARSELTIVAPQFFEKRPLAQGMGRTQYFIRYNRAALPMSTLTEGTTPTTETTETITQTTITTDQWGLFFALTDVSLLTTKHPVYNETLKLLADVVSRVMNALAIEALAFSTNRQYWDGSRANRAAITATDYINGQVLNKARAGLLDAGAPARAGELFVALMGPQVQADVLAESAGTNITNFSTLQAYSGNVNKIERGTVGIWLGFQIVRTNLIPKFTLNATGATKASSATAGSLASSTTYYLKMVRKDTQRGFSEVISAEQSQATAGGQTSIDITTPASPSSGVVYDIYFGAATGDANLYLAASSVLPNVLTNVGAVPANTNPNPPSTPPSGITIHPVYVFAAEACDEVPLDGSNMQGMVTPATPSDSDPLVQRRKMGAKWMTKHAIRDQTRVLVVEVASRF